MAAALRASLRKRLPGTPRGGHRDVRVSAQAQNSVQIDRRGLLHAGAASLALAPFATSVAAAPPLPLVPRIELAPGLSISKVIKGNWQLSGGHRGDRATDRTSGQAAVDDFDAFAAAGITTFDVADHYGPGELIIGRYLATRPERRAQVQVATKYCVFSPLDMTSVSKASVSKAVDTSLQRLGVTSIDLMQFYWGDYSIPRYVDAIKYLGDCQAEGKIRHIGVTNFDVPRLQKMTDAGVTIVSNQVQYSLLDRRPEVGPMTAFCRDHNIGLLPYGVVAGGFLSDKFLGVPPAQVRADTYSKSKYGATINEAGGWAWFQSLLSVLDGVAQKHGSSIANVATRWVLDRPQVPAVILGARNASHVDEHRAVFGLALDDGDRAAIGEVLARGRRPRGDCYAWERGGEW